MGFAGLFLCMICFSAVCSLPLDSTQSTAGQKNSTQPGKHELSELKEEVANLHKIERTRSRFDTKIAGSNSQTSDQSDSIQQGMRALNSNVIGFTVNLANSIIDLATGSTVVFDNVMYNAGNGYDKTTGIFTCPRSGMYIFYINVEAVHGREPAEIGIVKNGSMRIYAIAESMDENHNASGGNLLVEHLMEGDRVWVETVYYDNQDLFKVHTTFSGVLIEST